MERTEVPIEDQWNTAALYPNLETWEKDFLEWGRPELSPHWPELADFKETFSASAENLKKLLDCYLRIDRALTKLYTYAHLKHDEDVANDTNKQANIRITAILHAFAQEASWVEPEILQCSPEVLDGFLHAPALEPYRIYLEKIIRQKPHTLTADKEELFALSGQALATASKAFGAFNNADLKFPNVKNGSGKDRELSHASYALYLRDADRTLRENAFKAVHKSYDKYENTLCELINGQVQTHLFNARARHYPNCMEAALFPHAVDPSVYTSLIETVRARLGSVHKYCALRKKVMQLDELHLYDMYPPLVNDLDMKMDYLAAEKVVIDSVALLGEEYQNNLAKGLTEGRWVDRYENEKKRSGAYSSGCYDSMPYILMNYNGTLNDVFTLAHEAGHSMHSFLSNKGQPYHYSNYPIFVAEVASTFNEELLWETLMSRASSKEEKAYLLTHKIDGLRATLVRQTMFAEFELRLHTMAENGMPLTPASLKEEYLKLNVDYFGPGVAVDEEIAIEWARIPHFYYNFYVYQYATGISAAIALVDKVRKEGPEKYLKFLSSGSSKYPLELLKDAGVDMRSGEAVSAALDQFDSLVEQLEKTLQ